MASIEADRPAFRDFEIIVVNDGSRNADLLRYLGEANCTVVHLQENAGFAAANNAGFRAARGAYIMTLNADTVVRPGWLATMVAAIEKHPLVGAVGPTVLEWDSKQIQSAGSVWTPMNYRLFKPKFAGAFMSACSHVQSVYQVDSLIGVCVLFRRRALFEAGLFDERFINGWEDMDLSMTLLANGYTLLHAPAVIEHRGGHIRNSFAAHEYAALVHRNRKHFRSKWRGFAIDEHRLVRTSMRSRLLRSVLEMIYGVRHDLRRVIGVLSHYFK